MYESTSSATSMTRFLNKLIAQTMSPSKSTRSEQSPTLEERELRKELDEALQASNNLLGFIGTIVRFSVLLMD